MKPLLQFLHHAWFFPKYQLTGSWYFFRCVVAHQYQTVGSYSLEEQQASSQYLTQSSTLARYVTIKICTMDDISIKIDGSSKSLWLWWTYLELSLISLCWLFHFKSSMLKYKVCLIISGQWSASVRSSPVSVWTFRSNHSDVCLQTIQCSGQWKHGQLSHRVGSQ